jgi:hypothetical protein
VSTTEELLGRKSSGSGLEIREYVRGDPSRWTCIVLYPQTLTLTSPISGCRSVGIVLSRTQATEFSSVFSVNPCLNYPVLGRVTVLSLSSTSVPETRSCKSEGRISDLNFPLFVRALSRSTQTSKSREQWTTARTGGPNLWEHG